MDIGEVEGRVRETGKGEVLEYQMIAERENGERHGFWFGIGYEVCT
jgi:hypothetical protein